MACEGQQQLGHIVGTRASPWAGHLFERRSRQIGILSWIVVGLIVGWLAGQVMHGGGYGIVGDIVLGIIGGLVGGYLAGVLFGVADAVNGINVGSIIVAFIGAMILIGLSRLVLHPSRT